MIIHKVVAYGRWSLMRGDADCVCESWILTSPQVIMTWAILEMRSAACCLTLADLLFNLQRMVPQICGKYGFTRLPSAFTTVPKPFSITISWEYKHTSINKQITKISRFLVRSIDSCSIKSIEKGLETYVLIPKQSLLFSTMERIRRTVWRIETLIILLQMTNCGLRLTV